MLSKSCLAAATAALALGALTPLHQGRADESAGVKVGVLTCNVHSGWGFIFGSSRRLNCTFAGNDHSERYVGHVDKFGVDLGYSAGAVIAWAVFAPTEGIGKGALSGHYGGVTGSAAAGVGGGANVLVGGFHDSISLQPVSIQANSGLNVAAGLAEITLHRQG